LITNSGEQTTLTFVEFAVEFLRSDTQIQTKNVIATTEMQMRMQFPPPAYCPTSARTPQGSLNFQAPSAVNRQPNFRRGIRSTRKHNHICFQTIRSRSHVISTALRLRMAALQEIMHKKKHDLLQEDS